MCEFIRWTVVATLVATVMVCSLDTSFGQSAVPPASAEAATNLQVRYADARLRLAQADLERADEMNRSESGTVSQIEMKRLRTNVEVARRQLEIAREYTHGSALPTQLRAAEAAAELAKQKLNAVLKAETGSPGIVPKMELRRLRIKAEMAQIRVELWKDPSYIPSLIDQMQWQIDRLTEQVLELNQRVDGIGSR